MLQPVFRSDEAARGGRPLPPGPAQQELHLLRAVARALAEADSLEAALEVVLRGVCEAAGWALGQAWLVHPDGAVLVCSRAWYAETAGLEPFRAASQPLAIARGRGLPGRAWATREPAWSRGVGQDMHLARRRSAAQVGLKAGVAIPVLAAQEVVCVLEFFECEERAEDQRLVALVADLGGLLGGAMRRVQAEQALRASEARHRAVVDTAADAIVTMGSDGLVRSFNHAAERIFGYRAEEIVGQPLVRLMPRRFRRRHLAGLLRFLATGESRLLGRPTEVIGRRRDGGEVALELTVSAVPEPAGTLFAGILRDVTERKRAEAERARLLAVEQEQARRLRELATLKADFTAMVAHELGAPVAGISALAEMLSTGELGPADREHLVAAILAEAHLLSTLVTDVQAAASVERDDFMVRPQLAPRITGAPAAARGWGHAGVRRHEHQRHDHRPGWPAASGDDRDRRFRGRNSRFRVRVQRAIQSAERHWWAGRRPRLRHPLIPRWDGGGHLPGPDFLPLTGGKNQAQPGPQRVASGVGAIAEAAQPG